MTKYIISDGTPENKVVVRDRHAALEIASLVSGFGDTGTATIEDVVDDLKLYLLTQDTLNGYDVYDSAVVCARDEDDARGIHPSWCVVNHSDCCGDMCFCYDDWPEPHMVSVTLIGAAVKGTTRGLICASFNAG